MSLKQYTTQYTLVRLQLDNHDVWDRFDIEKLRSWSRRKRKMRQLLHNEDAVLNAIAEAVPLARHWILHDTWMPLALDRLVTC